MKALVVQRAKDDMFRLRFPESEIPRWAALYSYPGEDRIVHTLAPKARSRGYLERGEFLDLCHWKTPRSRPLCARNSAAQIREATEIALATRDERAKMYVLRSLSGVDWPTASVILHFCDRAPYPIIDYRALWSLGFAKPPATRPTFGERTPTSLVGLPDRPANLSGPWVGRSGSTRRSTKESGARTRAGCRRIAEKPA